MSQFPNIEALGLKIRQGYEERVVNAPDLEKILESAQKVYGTIEYPSDEMGWSNTKMKHDTHTALLVNVQKIKREPLKIEFESHVSSYIDGADGHSFIIDTRLPREFQSKKVRVTVQEIESEGT